MMADMTEQTDYRPTFDSFKRLLLLIAQERSVDQLLKMIVSGLSDSPHIALARIWLVMPGDLCHRCYLKDECSDQTRCLHLVASSGQSANSQEDWSQLKGRFQRFPMGVRKVGRIASDGEAIIEREIDPESKWLVNPIWAKREGIKGFAGQPLVFRELVLGVLMVFTRTNPIDEELDWIRMLADHAAAAIVNARAFDEIESLRKKLELENTYLKQEVDEAKSFGGFVGESPAMKGIQDQIEMVAQTDANVLILRESGTGKELVAR